MSEKESIIVQGAENIVEAINCNRTDIVRALLRQAKSIEEKEGDVHIVKEILNYGHKNQETSLILATKLDRIDCVRALLSAGANPCISNDEGKTAYQLCNGDSMKQVYITEFFQATAQSNIVRIQQLLDCGIPVNSSDGVVTNCRPIHWAASFANKETVATLLENGADINVQDQDGSTPLHDAIKRNSTEIIGVLLKYGARTDIKATSGSYEGKTAAILLEENNELQNKLLESTAGDSPTPDDELDRKTESSVCVTPTAVASREHYAGEKLQQETTLRFSNSSTNDLSISDVCNGASLSIANNMTASSSDANSDTIHYQASASAKLSEQIPHTNDVDSINENISQFSTEISLNDVGLDPRLDILWPPPQQISQLPGLPYIIKKELRIKISRSDQALIQRIYDIWRNQRHRFESLGYTLQLSLYSEYDHDHADMHNVITCVVNDSLVDMPQRYRISIRRNKLLIMSSDLSGMWYAVSTFFQLLQLFPDRALPQLQINDWPDILNRAVIVDVAHGVTPKMESLLELVDLLSFLKYNQLQLYLPAASVLQADDLHAIPYSSYELFRFDQYCQSRYISLIPHFDLHLSQESDILGSNRSDSIANSMEHVLQYCASYITSFCSSRYVHISISDKASSYDHDNISTYLVEQFSIWCGRNGRIMKYWLGPMIHEDVNVVWSLPPETVAVMSLDENYRYHESHCTALAKAGLSYYVSCKTCAQQSTFGRPLHAIKNIYKSARTAFSAKADGIIISDFWAADDLRTTFASHISFVCGAAFCWNTSTKEEFTLTYLPRLFELLIMPMLSLEVCKCLIDLALIEETYFIPSRNQAEKRSNSVTMDKSFDLNKSATEHIVDSDENCRELLNLVNKQVPCCSQSSLLCRILTDKQDLRIGDITSSSLQQMFKCMKVLQKEMCSIPKIDPSHGIIQDISIYVELYMFSLRLASAVNHHNKSQPMALFSFNCLTSTVKTDLANRLLLLIEPYQKAWLSRNLFGGLSETIGILHSTLSELIKVDQK